MGIPEDRLTPVKYSEFFAAENYEFQVGNFGWGRTYGDAGNTWEKVLIRFLNSLSDDQPKR